MASRFKSLNDSYPASASLDTILEEIKDSRPIISERDKARLPLIFAPCDEWINR